MGGICETFYDNLIFILRAGDVTYFLFQVYMIRLTPAETFGHLFIADSVTSKTLIFAQHGGILQNFLRDNRSSV